MSGHKGTTGTTMSWPQAQPLCLANLSGARGVVVIAPHPDDETIGCGGLVALLTGAGVRVHVVVVTDGGASHPSSSSWPPARLSTLRRAEVTEAVNRLGADPADLMFLDLPDSAMPVPRSARWTEAMDLLAARLDRVRPDLALLPWRLDPHGDHRAAHALATAALDSGAGVPARRLEYPVWLATAGQPEDRPDLDRISVWRLDIGEVRSVKRHALEAHVSQFTDLVADDPGGFRMTPAFIAAATGPHEFFFEARS